jgi:hypothetical protein
MPKSGTGAAKYFMVLLMAGYGLAAIRFGTVIPINNGLGWDGVTYAQIAQNPRQMLSDSRMDTYRMQRVVPCVVVHYGLRLLGVSPQNNWNIIRGFQVYNLLLLILGAWTYACTAEYLALSRRACWLGFVGLFGSFAVLRTGFYYPILTDITALVVGIVITYAYLSSRQLLLWCTAFVGAFCWPLILCMAVPLLLFPRKKSRPEALYQPLPMMLWAIPAVCVVAFALLIYFVIHEPVPHGAEPVWPATIPIAAAILFIWLAAGVKLLISRDIAARLRWPIAEITPGSVALVVALFAGVRLALAYGLSPVPGGISSPSILDHRLKYYLEIASLFGMAKPGIFLLAHVVYFGPIIISAVFLRRQVAQYIRALGLGPVLVSCLAIGLSVDSQSRHLIAFLPLLVIATVHALDVTQQRQGHDALFVLSALLASKPWLRLDKNDIALLSDMNYGPWMSTSSYLVQGITVGFLLMAFWLVYRERTVHSIPLDSELGKPLN